MGKTIFKNDLKASSKVFLYSCITILHLLAGSLAFAQTPGDAYQIFHQLQKSNLIEKPFEVTPIGNTSVVTYGAEKEGSSAIITRIFGPDSEYFLKIFDNLSQDNKINFARSFLSGLKSQSLLEKNVVDADGLSYQLNLNFLNTVDLGSLTETNSRDLIQRFLQQTNDQAFSFLNRSTRVQLFNGTFRGLTKESGKCFRPYGRAGRKDGNVYSTHWNPLLGEPQKYLSRIEGMVWIQGWEFHLKPQNSYQEFEEALAWVKKTLTKKVFTMTSPGHQRVVIPYPSNYNESKTEIANLARLLQIYVVLEGVAGQTGIESAAAKNLQQDTDLMESLNVSKSTGRGVLRLEPGRFGESLGIEFRAGTKDPRVQQFIEQTAVAYISSGDYNSLANFFGNSIKNTANAGQDQKDTENFSFTYKPQSAAEISQRFNIDVQTAQKYIQNMESVVMKRDDRRESKYKKEILYLPLWSWENLSFLSPDKKQRLTALGADYIRAVAQLPVTQKRDAYRLYLSDWVKHSNLATLFRNALQPKQEVQLPNIEKLVPEMAGIDLGLEETTQYPEKNVSRALIDAQGIMRWQETVYDMTPAEKSAYLRTVAETLMKKLGSNSGVYSKSTSGHGHGLDVQYQFLDSQNREWRVEWDGIGRSYDEVTGEVMPDSIRAGHIEIVTPKFQPTQFEINAIYSTYNELSILPKVSNGGGHINIDLKPFENNPKALARFLLLFFKHRSLISSMFQAPERLASAEPHEFSAELLSKLQQPNLTENQLKTILYNGGLFNQRQGRKTKYTQLDVSAYFQDVVPDEYKTGDFDIKSPKVEWKRNFDVDTKIRKMEFRLFNAPSSPDELKLQILLVRSLLKKAFSNESLNISSASDVDYVSAQDYNKDPSLAYQDLNELVQDLKLPEDLYAARLTESLSRNRLVLEGRSYKNKVKIYNERYPKMEFKKIKTQPMGAPMCSQIFAAA